MKKELEEQPKADVLMQMLLSCDSNGGLKIIIYYKNDIDIDSQHEELLLEIFNPQMNESIGNDEWDRTCHLDPGRTGKIDIEEFSTTYEDIIKDNRAIVKEMFISVFNPKFDSMGNLFNVECNGKVTSGGIYFFAEDLYSPNNAWNKESKSWIIYGLNLVYFKFIDFINPEGNTNIGYQVEVSGEGAIGTSTTEEGGALRCIGALNAINFLGMPMGDIKLKLKSETGLDYKADIKIRDHNGKIIESLSFLNQTITTEFTDFMFLASSLDIINNCYTIEISEAPVPLCGSMTINSMESHIGSSYGTPIKFDSGVSSQYFDFIQVDGTKSCLRAKIAGTYLVSGSILFESTNVGELISGEIYHYKGGVKYDTHVFNNIQSGNNYLTSTITCNVGDEIYLYGTSVNSMGGYDIIRSTQVSICPA